MTTVNITGLSKTFRTRRDVVHALRDVSVDVADGEYMVFLGPSGSGKTTALRCIAGLEQPDDGRIQCGDRVLVDTAQRISLPPEARGLAMVFQSYALWPHMTVAANVAFGVRMAGRRSRDADAAVREALRVVGLDGYGDRRINELSGGQMQRVGLARAIAIDPGIVLMDEPLSNLDPAIRIELRDQLKAMHQQRGRTTIHVTHDQEEALFLADRVTVFRSGRIEQCGSAEELRSRPVSPFVADFFGWRNRFPVHIEDATVRVRADRTIDLIPVARLSADAVPSAATGGVLEAAVHPDGVRLALPGSSASADWIGVPATVLTAAFYSGWQVAGTVVIDGGGPSLHFRDSQMEIKYAPGDAVEVHLDPAMVRLFSAQDPSPDEAEPSE